eukprot:TRINITY_DN13197_c0_g1_i1.p1 TRINITY_DN13197_c0_g1~~TRINITY_DN13197_c0_g1_i1.p1  ORF type:complete len:434 (+),score=83.46 TRINITY_DN13197_c0_g1_i1:76-1302(+)
MLSMLPQRTPQMNQQGFNLLDSYPLETTPSTAPVVLDQQQHRPHQQIVVTDKKTNLSIKLPPSAFYNSGKGCWEETDRHRLQQRQKQIGFGKVTVGYRNYISAVAPEAREEGNSMHPRTPRIEQVCSKRSWDAQIGQWRRTLHAWDTGVADQSKVIQATSNDHLERRNHFCLDSTTQSHYEPSASTIAQNMPEVEIGCSDRGRETTPVLPPLKVKCVIKNDPTGMCKMVVSPQCIPFPPFKRLLEEKIGLPIANMVYIDEDSDRVLCDDGVSLKLFLDGAGSRHTAKLIIDLEEQAQDDVGLSQEVQAAFDLVVTYFKCTQQQQLEFRKQLLQSPPPSETPLQSPAIPPLVSPQPSQPSPKGTPSSMVHHLLSQLPNILNSGGRDEVCDATISPLKNHLDILVSQLDC